MTLREAMTASNFPASASLSSREYSRTSSFTVNPAFSSLLLQYLGGLGQFGPVVVGGERNDRAVWVCWLCPSGRRDPLAGRPGQRGPEDALPGLGVSLVHVLGQYRGVDGLVCGGP
jgi:hypothetical protein